MTRNRASRTRGTRPNTIPAWADSDGLARAAPPSLFRESSATSRGALKNEPGVAARPALKGLSLFGRQPMPTGALTCPAIDFREHQVLRPVPPRSRLRPGTSFPTTSEHLRPAGASPRPEKQPSDRRSWPPRRVRGVPTTRSVQGPGGEGPSIFPGHGHRPLREHPALFRSTFRHGSPAGDNQVPRSQLTTSVWWAAAFHLRAEERARGTSRWQAYFRITTEKHGQYRAHADQPGRGCLRHYGTEGCTAPIYKSDSLAFRRVEDHRQGPEGRALPLTPRSRTGPHVLHPGHQSGPVCKPPAANMEWIDGKTFRVQGHGLSTRSRPTELGEHARGRRPCRWRSAGEGPSNQETRGAKNGPLAPRNNPLPNSCPSRWPRGERRTSYRRLVPGPEVAGHSRSTVKCDCYGSVVARSL